MKQPFQFKQFCVDDSKCAMKVGTDSVLLGSWTKTKDPKTILDIGAGSGLLSLMMAQKYPKAEIVAVEIDEEACQQCQENFGNSPFKNPLTVVCENFLTRVFEDTFDLIISNPPYFHRGLLPKSKARQSARNNQGMPFDKMVFKALALLTPHGKLVMVLPQQRLDELEELLHKFTHHITRKTNVYSFENKPSNRCLVEMSRGTKQEKTDLLIYQGINEYSEQFLDLTKGYYLDK